MYVTLTDPHTRCCPNGDVRMLLVIRVDAEERLYS